MRDNILDIRIGFGNWYVWIGFLMVVSLMILPLVFSYTPNSFTVKKDVPVELEIDTKLVIRGCMSTMVLPDYNVAHLLTMGKTTLKFTPTKTGVTPFTCSMGSKQGEFIVVE